MDTPLDTHVECTPISREQIFDLKTSDSVVHRPGRHLHAPGCTG